MKILELEARMKNLDYIMTVEQDYSFNDEYVELEKEYMELRRQEPDYNEIPF